MTQFALGSFLLGAVLGLRFKVLVLVPVTLAALFAATFFAVSFHEPLLQTLAMNLLTAFALQAGYLLGSAVRASIVAARAARVSIRPAKVARSA